MKENDYLRDIHEIKDLMNRSTTFVSLSGLSGILAGIYALAGAYIVHALLDGTELSGDSKIAATSEIFTSVLAAALAVLSVSLITAVVLTLRKAKTHGETVWNATSRRLLINFAIPLVTGGIFALLLLKNGSYGLIAAITLIFYGLACVNASKYTLRDVRPLGITIVVLGLLAASFERYGIGFWAIGFGVCHIVYGFMMYLKYDRKPENRN